jgi:uncharacterized membrane protein
MNTLCEPAVADTGAGTAPQAPAHSAAAAASDLVRALAELLGAELALARQSLSWLLIGAVAVAVVGLGAWLGFNMLVVASLHAVIGSWPLALLLGIGLQLLALAILLHRLRRRARDLTLPQSRAAVAHLIGRPT